MIMDITKIDWKDISKKLAVTQKDFDSENNVKSNGSTLRLYTLDDLVPNCIAVFWDKLYQVLASIEPIKIDNKYSPKATISSIPDEVVTPYGNISRNNIKGILAILNDVPRSKTLPGRAADHPQWSQLVPLWLAAYKHYKNIPYSAWIKDSMIGHMIGPSFYGEIISVPEDFRLDINKLAELRKEALTTKQGTSAITSPVRKGFYMTEDWRVPINSKVAAIILQIWLANVQNRHEDMILDINNWDNIPEPYDAKIETVERNFKRSPTTKRQYIEELPF